MKASSKPSAPVRKHLSPSSDGSGSLFQNAPYPMWVVDAASQRFLDVNEAATEAYGYSRLEFLKMRLPDITVESLVPQAKKNGSSGPASGESHVGQMKLSCKNGSIVRVQLKTRELEYRRHKAQLAILQEVDPPAPDQPIVPTTAIDLAARRPVEQAPHESGLSFEALYRELFDNSLEGIFRSTPDGRLLSANPALVRMLGYETESQILAMNVKDLYLDPERRVHNMETILERGELRDFEIHLRRCDGEILIALENSRAIRDASGQIVLYEGMLSDITERQNIEQALRASEAELRALFEAIPDLVLVLDKDGRYLKIVPGHSEMLAAPPYELLGHTFHEVFSQQKADEFLGHIQKALLTRKSVQFEYALLIGARIRWFSGATAPLTEDTVVWVAREITGHKQAEEQVQQRLLELEALHASGLALSQSLDPRAISRKVIDVLTKRLNWHHAAVRVRRGESEDVELLAFGQSPNFRTSEAEAYDLARLAITKVGQGMAGWVMRHGRMINSGDLSQDPRYHATFPNMFSGLHVPIWAAGRVLGCISVESHQHTAFNEDDERFLTTLASQAAAALENARLFSETQQRAAESLAIYEHTRDLAAQSDLSTLLKMLAERISALLKVPGGAVYLYNEAADDLEIVVATDASLPSGTKLGMGEGLAGLVAQKREALIVDDYQTWDGRPPQFTDRSWAAVLEVPMVYRGELIGVLAAYDSHSPDATEDRNRRKFNDADLRLLSLFGSSAAGAIYSARLFEQISRRAGEFEALYQTAADLSSQADLQTLLNTVIDRARDLMGAAGAAVHLFNPQSSLLEMAAVNDPGFPAGVNLALGEGMSGRCAQSKQPVIVTDYRTWEGRSLQYEGIPYTSAIALPMLYNGQLIGVLDVFNRADAKHGDPEAVFTPQDVGLLELLANSAAGAVYVTRLLDQTRRRVEQLSALHAVDTAIGSTTDLRVSLQAVLESVIRQLHVDAADVLLLNASTLSLQYAAGSGFSTTEINRTSLFIGAGAEGKAALQRRMIEIPDLAAPDSEFTRTSLTTAERLRAYVVVPLVAKGEVKGVLEVFQRQPLGFDEELKSLLQVLAGQAALAIDNAQLFEGLEKANLELTMAYDATIEGWSQALELRDQETQGHSSRVLGLTLRLASALGLPDRQMRDFRRGVLLHDIGKMGIPDAILHKPGPLTAEEWQVMRQHPKYAYDMLAPIVYLRNSLDIPYAHHEKWDGTGYPRGLKGETIPLAARIFAVVDVYDALTSNRPYRGAWSEEQTLEYIAAQSGQHFDPLVVETFLKMIRS